MRSVGVERPGISLQAFLKVAGIAQTGGQAKRMVQEGRVRVNGQPEPRRGRRLDVGDVVETAGERLRVVDASEGVRSERAPSRP